MQDFLNHPTTVTVKPKTLWIRFYADISETIHPIVLQLVGGLYAKICPLKMASDYVNMMPRDQGNVRYEGFHRQKCSYLTFPLSIGMILR